MKLQMEIRQTQQLKMTPLLQQSIHMLQLSSFELKEYIEREALENPWIDLKEPSFSAAGLSMQEEIPLYQKNQQPSLQEFLIQQVTFLPIPENEKRIICSFILHINENGYLKEPLAQLAEEYDISLELAGDCLTYLQSLDPPGTGARTLRESLLLQAKRSFPEDETLTVLISDHLQDVADQNKERLCAVLELNPSELEKCLTRLQSLHPKPGLEVGISNVDLLVPDVYIKEQEKGYSISLNSQIVPGIELNQEYKQMMKEYKEAASFLEEKYKIFLWLKKSVEQRQWTILAITEEMLRRQPTMVSEGICSLSPLTRKEVADELGIHESTVSRAVRNKVIETPAGTYYMKEFFPSRTKKGSSSAIIKQHIRDFITKEDPTQPLSDQKLADLLAQEGIDVSRRTLAKYRDSLNILSSSKRRRNSLR